uniref:Putative ovule protein n=1 Tax=Solanum chacoense TaxID=4108 RepID=A0A0V0GS56_SOLCH
MKKTNWLSKMHIIAWILVTILQRLHNHYGGWWSRTNLISMAMQNDPNMAHNCNYFMVIFTVPDKT